MSVVTPVFNGEKYLRECIESVLAQSYENWDYTIVDNASTDGSLAIAYEYAEAHPQVKVRSHDAVRRASSRTTTGRFARSRRVRSTASSCRPTTGSIRDASRRWSTSPSVSPRSEWWVPTR